MATVPWDLLGPVSTSRPLFIGRGLEIVTQYNDVKTHRMVVTVPLDQVLTSCYIGKVVRSLCYLKSMRHPLNNKNYDHLHWCVVNTC